VRLDIGGLRLFFDIEGAGLAADGPITRAKPALLLLHGGPGIADHTSFKPWFGRFADTHQVIYLDQRGQGRNDQRDDPSHWDLATWADVTRFCAALEIEQPVLPGNSTGGMVAMARLADTRTWRRRSSCPAPPPGLTSAPQVRPWSA
jgi:pimeloyl-ACP methyl ester carboxylesterase